MMLKRFFLCTIPFLYTSVLAQEFTHCTRPVAEKPIKATIKGRFTNIKKSLSSVSIDWHHNPATPDTFFINIPEKEKLSYITAGDYRFLVYNNSGAKRQIGGRHLRESIGDTPLKYEFLEYLANGWTQCPDSATNDPHIFTTAFPESQSTLQLDTLPQPNQITVKRFGGDYQISISEWSDFSGVSLPKKMVFSGTKFVGEIKFEAKP